MEEAIFGACALVTLVSAIAVVTRRNPIYSAFFLIVSLLGMAVLVAQLHATFLAAMHVLVYTGAIMVLFLFVIMLLNLREQDLGAPFPLVFRILAGALALGFFAVLAGVLWKAGAEKPPAVSAEFGGVRSVGELMFKEYVLPFELVSILIIVAVLGGVVLARRGGKRA